MKASTVLREARRRAGLTQAELAVRAGVKQPAISRIERGVVSPTVDMLERLLNECGDQLEAVARRGVGVDRTLIHEMLALSPDERLRRGIEEGKNLERLLRSVAT